MRSGGAGPKDSFLYGLVLRVLLPRPLRQRYGPQIQQTFGQLRAAARREAGVFGVARIWMREVRQLVALGPALRRDLLDSGRRRGDTGSTSNRSASGLDSSRSPLGSVARQAPGGPGAGGARREDRAGFLDHLGQIGKHTLRGLRRSPGFAAAVVATLALGVGANATMFGIVDRLLLSAPPHIRDADRVRRMLVVREFIGRKVTTSSVTHPDYRDLDDATSMSATAALGARELTFGRGTEAFRVNVVFATPSLFPLVGVEPELGRFYTEAEDALGASPVAVLGYDFWRRRFGRRPDVLGSEVVLSGEPHTVVGIAPPGFTGVDLKRVDVWVPLRSPANEWGDSWIDSRGFYWLDVVVRLAPGVADTAAATAATALHRAGRADDRYYDPEAEVRLASLTAAEAGAGGSQGARASASTVAWWLTGVAAIVLLIACANTANLLLARGMRRRREIGIRLALGISPRRLVGELLAESVLLALFGGAVALAMAHWGAELVRAVLLPDLHWEGSPVDGRLVAFTAAASLLAAALAGIVPALDASRPSLTRALEGGARAGGRRRSMKRLGLLVAQAALSVVLLVGAGLFVRSLQRTHEVDLGFEPDGLIVAVPELDAEQTSRDQRRELFQQALERLRRIPAVEHASAAATMPFGMQMSVGVRVPGREELPVFSSGGPYVYPVTADHFATMGIDIVHGRGFTDRDHAGAPRVAVVEETLARAYWPDEDPIGECLEVDGTDGFACHEVVGIVEDSVRYDLVEEANGQFYLPIEQAQRFQLLALFVRADPRSVPALLAAVRQEIQAIAPGVRYVEVAPLSARVDPRRRAWALGATMFSLFGALALVIAAVGLYGVLAFDVAQRTREIGVRSALGASTREVVGMIVRRAVWLTALGLAAGAVIALLAGPWIEPLLFDVQPRDPVIFATVAALLLAVAAAAAALPGLRAARVDPLVALRAQ